MKYLTFSISLLFALSFQAQSLEKQTLSNGGGFSENNNLSLEWTLGEMKVSELSNGNLIISEGFHQGNDLTIGFLETDAFTMNIFPNPTQDIIQLQIDASLQSDLTMELIDMKGSRILEKRLFENGSAYSEIDLSTFENGIYILLLTDQNSKKTYEFKVQKIN